MSTLLTFRTPRASPRLVPAPERPAAFHGCSSTGAVRIPGDAYHERWRRYAVSKPSIQEDSIKVIHNGLPVIEWPEQTTEWGEEGLPAEVSRMKDIGQMISDVRRMLASMSDGEISISAYDTAWVALVRDIYGSGAPQFPSTLQWIIHNQLDDGSWGDECKFSAHDRLINTLACVIALKSWSICPEICERGISFLRDNMWRLAEEDAEHMPIGFEIAFPSLVEIAKAQGLEFPYDDPALQHIHVMRSLKLERIPKDVMHRVPTTLLHSLEGMPGLDWEKLLGLQCIDGSFLFSPSSTAYALMQTGDEKCLKYLQRAVHRFNGGVPNVYPVDLFEHLWAVDRLQRLGISRYFEPEIKECLDYVYRYWTENGICWARNSRVHEVDDTAMAFRLLRLQGYDVSPDVFSHFEKDGDFFCFAGQSNQAVTGMYNLNRASQVSFPGEEILERARSFSYKFLREKQAANELLDKWIITKDLPGEVRYALDFPFYASLPRIEARLYVEQYGGRDDVWIGKTLYRMPYVNNEAYLQVAKFDYNQCQVVHQREWQGIQKWYSESRLKEHGVSRGSLLRSYFLAAASIFEPERRAERLGWARTAALAKAVSSQLRNHSFTGDMRRRFVREFLENRHHSTNITRSGEKRTGKVLLDALRQLIDALASEAPPEPRDWTRHHLRIAWEEWLLALLGEDEWEQEEFGKRDTETHARRLAEGKLGMLLVRTIEACAGRLEPTGHSEYDRLARLTSSVCHRLHVRMQLPQGNMQNNGAITSYDKAVESDMQELLQCVLQSYNLDKRTKQTFLTVAKSCYYAAHCPSNTLNGYITKVLFEPVV